MGLAARAPGPRRIAVQMIAREWANDVAGARRHRRTARIPPGRSARPGAWRTTLEGCDGPEEASYVYSETAADVGRAPAGGRARGRRGGRKHEAGAL